MNTTCIRATVVEVKPTFEGLRECVRQRPSLAALRQYHCQFARRKPAIARGRTTPRPCKLDRRLDRRLLAELCPALRPFTEPAAGGRPTRNGA
jgi:hypothetical protein